MKKAVFLLLACSLSLISMAQIRKIPAQVTEAFKEKYPQASNVEWKDKVSGFTASFENDGINYEAKFNNRGEWQSTEQQIEQDEIPETVKEGFEKSKYSEWDIKEIHRIELPGEIFQYRVQVEKSEVRKKNLLFNSGGRLLKDRITI